MDFVSGGSLHHFLKKRPNRRTDDPLAKRLFFQARAYFKGSMITMKGLKEHMV